jgi:hypothetical protein
MDSAFHLSAYLLPSHTQLHVVLVDGSSAWSY